MKALLLLLLLGTQLFQWEALQIRAWNQMIRENRQSATLAEAVHLTLSGSAPCSLCHQITKAQIGEESSETLISTPNPDHSVYLPLDADLLWPPLSEPFTFFTISHHHQPLNVAPEVPPPIFLHLI